MKDLIERQEAIDALNKMKIYRPLDSDRYVISDCLNKIVDLPSAQPEPHWISCSERLPEKNCRCLTTNTAWGAFEVDFNVWINGEWLYPNEKPIAWMPLPEPYKEASE